MKRSLKMMVTLFALFIATTGFSTNTQTEQSTTAQTTAVSEDMSEIAGYYPDEVGYLSLYVKEGVAEVIIESPGGRKEYELVIGYKEFQLEAGTTYDIHGAYGFIIGSFGGDINGTIIGGERTEVEISLIEG